MRIAEYKCIGFNKEQRISHHNAEFDDDGNIIEDAFDETVNVEVPVMGMVYRDATPEEIAEIERQKVEMPESDPSLVVWLDALETVTDDIVLLMADLIGGN